jgi:hypothetical protein
MSQSRSVVIRFVILLLVLSAALSSVAGTGQAGAAAPVPQDDSATAPAAVQVALSAAQTTRSWDSRLGEPEPVELPLFHLGRQRQATPAAERTLTLHVSGLQGGQPVEIELVSRHQDPSTDAHHRQAERVVLPNRPCSASDPCTVQWTLDATAALSDFYRLVLYDGEGNLLWENPDPERPDLVALDTWEVDLDDHTVRIYYAVLFPFARGEKNLDDRLPPNGVHDFIANQFEPNDVETWKTQFHTWGFAPIYPAWDPDNVVEIFFTSPPFALFDGIDNYTVSMYADGTPYPERRIWLSANAKSLERYDSLENGLKVIFSHEFFHLVQWNVRLGSGCTVPKWKNVFIEAQATFAPSAQYPEIEMSREHLVSTRSQHSAAAQRFLERRLKTSYATIEAEEAGVVYDVALYWRFLYEQFGDLGVLRVALEEMACRPVDDVPSVLDEVMDAALARLQGPFSNFEQSMVAFAQANYALRLENGRCTAEDVRVCQGRYYDPHGMYTIPLAEAALSHRESTSTYDGAIPVSFGTDLIDVRLSPDLDGHPLAITFRSTGANFGVKVRKLYADGEPRDPARGKTGVWALTPQPEAMVGECSAECHYLIPRLNLEQYDRLALIIVRLDVDEVLDPAGVYHLVVDSAQ